MTVDCVDFVMSNVTFCHAGTGVTNVMGVYAILEMGCLLLHYRHHTTEGGN